MNTVVQILGAVGESGRGDRTDSQLLELFVKRRDEGAFAAVVRRHGPMVLGVCRRVLHNAADADDAFQAAFLVLARKAASIGGRDRLGPWLHGVAFNASRKLKRANARRVAHERAGATAEAVVPAEPQTDLLAILDEELAKLPDRYRAVLVMCELEGRTRKEAAQLLGCPEGTVGGRLARARDLLAAKLSARGIVPAAGFLAVALGRGMAAAVSPGAVAALVRAVGVDGLAHAAATGFVSRRVLDTTEGVVRSMFATKLQKAGAAVLCCGLALVCATGGIHLANAQPERNPVPALLGGPEQKPVNPLTLLGLPNEAPKAVLGAPKAVTVVPLRKLDATETARALSELFAKHATVTPLPEDKSLLVYADAKITKDIGAVLVKMGEPAPNKATAFKLDTTASAAETAKTLTEVFGKGRIVCVPVPNEQVLLVYASEQDTQTVQKLLAKLLVAAEPTKEDGLVRKTIVVEHRKVREVAEVLQKLSGDRLHSLGWEEPNKLLMVGTSEAVSSAMKIVTEQDKDASLWRQTPRFAEPARTFTLNFESVKWSDVLDWYAKESGLALVTTVRPTGTVSIKPGKDRKFTLGEVTDLINEALMQQKSILVRRKATFFIHPADEKLDPGAVRQIELKDLGACGNTEVVEASIPCENLDAADIKDELRKLLTPFGEIVLAKGRWLIVRDTAGSVARIVKTLEPLDKPTLKTLPPGSDPRFGNTVPLGRAEVDPNMVRPEAKPVTFKFQDARWSEVFEVYEKATGLRGTIKSKPAGTFTFVPPKEAKRYTLAEFTDILNDALLKEKHLLVRYGNAFAVVPADEAVDPKFVTHIELDELAKRGRTELVSVHIPLPAAIGPGIETTARKLIGPVGKVGWYPPANTLFLRDTVENLRTIVVTVRALEKAGSPDQPHEK